MLYSLLSSTSPISTMSAGCDQFRKCTGSSSNKLSPPLLWNSFAISFIFITIGVRPFIMHNASFETVAVHVGHNVSVVCHCFQQWPVEHSHTSRPGSGQPCSTDAHQDRHIVQAVVATRTASREEIQAHVAPVISPRTIGNHLLATGLRSCVPLKESTGERNATLFSSVMRVGSVCMRVMNVHVYGGPGESHLPECINLRHTGPTSGFMVWGRGHQLQLMVTFGVSVG